MQAFQFDFEKYDFFLLEKYIPDQIQSAVHSLFLKTSCVNHKEVS